MRCFNERERIICYRKSQIGVSFHASVLLLKMNCLKSADGSTATLTMLWRNSRSITGQTKRLGESTQQRSKPDPSIKIQLNRPSPAGVSCYWKTEEKSALIENLTKFLWEDAMSQSGFLKRINRHYTIVREALGTRYKRSQKFSVAWNVAASIVVNFTAWSDQIRFTWK